LGRIPYTVAVTLRANICTKEKGRMYEEGIEEGGEDVMFIDGWGTLARIVFKGRNVHRYFFIVRRKGGNQGNGRQTSCGQHGRYSSEGSSQEERPPNKKEALKSALKSRARKRGN